MLHFWTKPGTSLSSLPVVFPGMPEGFLSELKQQCNIRINGLTAQPEITLPQPKTQCLGLNIWPEISTKACFPLCWHAQSWQSPSNTKQPVLLERSWESSPWNIFRSWELSTRSWESWRTLERILCALWDGHCGVVGLPSALW